MEALAALLLDNLDRFARDLEAGAIVVITDDRIRVRALPLLPPADRPLGSVAGPSTPSN